jgi:hypothetical protein
VSVEIRASDEDRRRAVAALERHTEAGRLTLEEFSQRIGDVYAARTLGDLAVVSRDLPAEPVVVGSTTARDSNRRDLLIIFAVAAFALLLMGIYMAATR